MTLQTQKLLEQIRKDTWFKIPENERDNSKLSSASLIWNLFHGGYQYSYSNLEEILKELYNNE